VYLSSATDRNYHDNVVRILHSQDESNAVILWDCEIAPQEDVHVDCCFRRTRQKSQRRKFDVYLAMSQEHRRTSSNIVDGGIRVGVERVRVVVDALFLWSSVPTHVCCRYLGESTIRPSLGRPRRVMLAICMRDLFVPTTAAFAVVIREHL
jgi:hypothetical protein